MGGPIDVFIELSFKGSVVDAVETARTSLLHTTLEGLAESVNFEVIHDTDTTSTILYEVVVVDADEDDVVSAPSTTLEFMHSMRNCVDVVDGRVSLYMRDEMCRRQYKFNSTSMRYATFWPDDLTTAFSDVEYEDI